MNEKTSKPYRGVILFTPVNRSLYVAVVRMAAPSFNPCLLINFGEPGKVVPNACNMSAYPNAAVEINNYQ